MPLWLLTGLMGVRKAAVALFGAAMRYPWQAACIALLLASAWLWHGKSVALSDLKGCKAGRVADAKAANARLAVSNASIATLQGKIAEQNAAIDKQSAAYTAAKKRADADQVKLADQAKSSDAQIARFRELAAKKGDGKCEAPAALLDEVGKL